MLLIGAIILLVIAFLYYRQAHKRRDGVRQMLRFDSDISVRLRISVVVHNVKSVGYITSFLREGLNAYQVVVVNDFGQDETLLRAITHYFGLFKVSYASTGELPEQALRGVYRSHRRLYAKLLVVDSAHSAAYTPLEVGAVVSSYDYTLYITHPYRLRYGAIEDLLLELALRHEGSVDEITQRFGWRVKLIRREAALPKRERMGKGEKSKIVRVDYNIIE